MTPAPLPLCCPNTTQTYNAPAFLSVLPPRHSPLSRHVQPTPHRLRARPRQAPVNYPRRHRPDQGVCSVPRVLPARQREPARLLRVRPGVLLAGVRRGGLGSPRRDLRPALSRRPPVRHLRQGRPRPTALRLPDVRHRVLLAGVLRLEPLRRPHRRDAPGGDGERAGPAGEVGAQHGQAA